MPYFASATDLAIRLASRAGKLRIEERPDTRFGGTFFAICDDHGTIEVALSEEEAKARVAACA